MTMVHFQEPHGPDGAAKEPQMITATTPTNQIGTQEIHDRIQRHTADITSLKVSRQSLALAKQEGNKQAADGYDRISQQIAELEREIEAGRDALPSATTREQSARAAERQHVAASIRWRINKLAADIDQAVARITPNMPAEADLVQLRSMSLLHRRLRAALLDVEGEAPRARDGMDELFFAWKQLARDRERLFDRVLHAVKTVAPSSSDIDIERLRALADVQSNIRERK
jgi:hypothetical protein